MPELVIPLEFKVTKKMQNLDGFQDRLGSLNVPYSTIATMMGRAISKRFDQKLNQDKRPWIKLNKKYAEWKVSKGRSGIADLKFGRRGGLSLQQAPQESFNATQARISINGSIFPYARLHQEGIGGMPKRQFFFFRKYEIKTFSDVMKAYLLG